MRAPYPPCRSIALALVAVAAIAAPSSPAHAETEEQKLVRIAQKLKPISDSQWNEIAGSKVSETYEVAKGDTLWDVSKRLFANAFYWPKVWSLNASITNPHIISPGQKLVFLPGSSESTPKLSPGPTPESPASAARQAEEPATGAREYEKIPPDRWAPIDLSKTHAKHYDDYGLDRELKIDIPRRFSFRVPSIANDTTVPYLGEIIGSRREGVGLSQHETVFLKSHSQDLQVGTTYTILSEPEYARERKSDRSGYIYYASGEVRIVGVKDELYVGVLTRAYDVIQRGDRVYPLLPSITEIKPLPARLALEALVTVTAIRSTRNTAQFHVIHLDRGIEDGVQVGNVFRVYDYYDPTTKEKLTESDFLLNADAIVIHATAQFSTALIIRSRDMVGRGDFGVLLTDVSDLEKQISDRVRGFGEGAQASPEDKELDELDELDRTSGEGLGRKEETEIKELDQWDKTKDLQLEPHSEPTVPSAADRPTDEAEKAPLTEPEPVPATPIETAPPKEPSLDQTLDSPTVSPPGLEPPPPPANIKPVPEQTLDAPSPPPPTAEEAAIPGESTPNEPQPRVEPMTPETSPVVEPAVPTAPDDIESKSQ